MRHTSKLQFILAALCSITIVACDEGSDDASNTGTGGSGPMTGGGGAPAAITTFKITDFETASTETGKYDGYSEDTTRGWQMAWFTYTDTADGKSAGATITPAEGAAFEAVEDASRAGNAHVGNIKGGGFKSWGAGMGFNFKAPTPAPVNLTEFKGISFWAKSATGTYTIKVKVVDARNTPASGGGTCVEGMDAGMPKAGLRCFDVPLAKASLTNEWKRFDLTWEQFKPEGWGMTGYMGPQTDSVISFQFQVGTEASWDISVDEVGLIQ